MCIISNNVNAVAKTKLLVAVNLKTNKQFVVYSNIVDNEISNNAMILPVPNPTSVKFHNLTSYPNIFDDCEKMFEKHLSKSCKHMRYNISSNMLEVFNVGSYKVSIAHSIEDIKRINTNEFSLLPGCESMLFENYSNPIYGFIICKLNIGNQNYHPFGYSHNLPRNKKVFIPTKHYHPHNNLNFNENMSTLKYSLYQDEKLKMPKEEWDHDIYLFNISSKNNNNNILVPRGVLYEWNKTFNINSDLANFDFENIYRASRYRVVGKLNNEDLILDVINNETNK